ncbi:hypothetical protein [Vibrio sp. T11.5]|uniref:hypothetical protein n=1 Tax=Vibrio sp. T11.5 TaxID=2998836 RepID=UPI0022CD2B1E|nr:hypothetical protein [Vibrio sp. T11.5]MDA0118053.1 hypothetical protein [Vibrio sp. T11.5]
MDEFGKLLIEKLRDVSIELCEGLTESRYESPGHKEIQNEIEAWSPEQKALLVKTVTYCIDGGINDFLFNLDKAIRKSENIALSVGGQNITTSSESLVCKLYGDGGWQKKFSKYGKPNT